MITSLFSVRDGDRIIFYRQMATMLSAGLTLLQAFSTLSQSSPTERMRGVAAGLGERVSRGDSFTAALAAYPKVFPEYQIELIRIGELSGRLAENLNLIAAYLERTVRSRRKLISGLLYPLFLFHLAIFVVSLPLLFQSRDFTAYLIRTLGLLLLLYLIFFGCRYILPRLLGIFPFVKRQVDFLILFFPVAGGLIRRRNTANFTYSYRILHEAGVGAVEGLRRAAAVCSNEFIRQKVLRAADLVERGEPISGAIRRAAIFPVMVVNMWATGETGGDQSAMLEKISEYLWEEAERGTEEVVRWTPRIVYLGITVYVGWCVIRAWLFYFQEIDRLMEW